MVFFLNTIRKRLIALEAAFASTENLTVVVPFRFIGVIFLV